VSAMRQLLVFSANHAWRPCAWRLLAATLAALIPVPAAAAADADSKLVVGYVAAVSSDHFVLVLDRAGYPGQVRGTQVRLALDRNTRVLDGERPAAPAAIQPRRQATVIYDETRGANVAREVRLIGMLPAGVALPGAETAPRNPPAPDSSPAGAVGRGDGWRTSYDAFVAEVQSILQSRGSYNSDLAARFQGQRVTWDGESMAFVVRPGKGSLGSFLEVGFPQRRWRLRDGSTAFVGFVVDKGGTRVPTRESKAIAAVNVPLTEEVLPTGQTGSTPDVVRVSFVLKRVWIQPIDPREHPKLAGNSTLAIQTDSPRLVTRLSR
jgi:hypothetical protein